MADEDVVDKSNLLKKFWDLAEPNDTIRIDAAEELINLLKKKQSDQDDELDEDLSYTLQRLIKGLSSQRKAARLGFYIVVCELLKSFKNILIPNVLKLISTFLFVKGSKQDQSNLVIGQALAFGAIIRSGRLNNINEDELSNVLKGLLNLEQQKGFTKTLITKLIIESVKQVKEKSFIKCLWPHLEKRVQEGWKMTSSNNFMLLLNISKCFPAIINKEFLSQYWNVNRLYNQSNYSKFSMLIIESTSGQPNVHPVCYSIIDHALEQPMFANFWHDVIDEPLFGSKKDRLGFLGFELFKHVVPKLNVETLKNVFTSNFLHLLIVSASNSHLFLNGAARSVCNFLVDLVKNTDDADLQIGILNNLCKEPGSVMFDRKSGTKTISTMLLNFKDEALHDYIGILKIKFAGKDGEQDGVRKFIIKQLGLTLNYPSVQKNDDLKIELLKFLFLHSYCSISGNVSDIEEDLTSVVPFAEDVREAAISSFETAMGILTKLGQGWKPRIVAHLDVLHSLVAYVDKLVKHQNVTVIGLNKSKIIESWNHTLREVEKLKLKMKDDDEQSNEYNSFQLLYLYLLLQLFTSPDKTIDLIQEIEECSKRATKKHKRRASKKVIDEPEWVEVVVDILMSMLSQGNKLTRSVVDNVFCLICPHLTTKALQQILDVIGPSADENEEDPLVEESDENESDDDDEEGEDDLADSEDESMDGDDENSVGNEELRSKVFQALGPAVDDGEEEEEEETYLDDDQMFKLDDALAQAFKSMKKPKNKRHSEKDESVMKFRLRCIDLLDILIRVEPKLNFLLKMILPLNTSLKFGVKNKNQKPLVDKCITCINHLCKVKKFSDSFVEESELKELLAMSLKKLRTATNPQVNHSLANCCIFIMLCNRSIEPLKTQKKTEEEVWYIPLLNDSLKNFFTKKYNHLPSSLFQTLLLRNKAVGWNFRETVQEYIFNPKIRLFNRTQGLNIFCSIIKCGEKPVDVSNEEIVNVTQIVKQDWAKICKLVQAEFISDLDKTCDPDLKPKHVMELLRLLQTILEVDARLFKSETFKGDQKLTDMLLKVPVNRLEKDGRKSFNRSILLLTGKPVTEFRPNRKRPIENGVPKEEKSVKKLKKKKLQLL